MRASDKRQDRVSQSLRRSLTLIFMGAILGVLAFAQPAHAVFFDLFIFENADGADVSELNLWVDVQDGGSYVNFEFHNDSDISSAVTKIYFEDPDVSGWSLINGGIEEPQPAGVDFQTPAGGNVPGSISGFGGAWSGTLFSAKAAAPGPTWGINPNESLSIRFDYDGGTFQDVINRMNEPGGMRIVQHIQAVGPQSLSVWGSTEEERPTDPIPLPASVWLLGSGLMALAGTAAIRRMR